jgi:hypothetical protein
MRLGDVLINDPRRMLMVGGLSAAYLSMTLTLSLEPTVKATLGLLGTWLLFAALIRWVMLRSDGTREPNGRIPVAFSGELGPYSVQPRGDGRVVEVTHGHTVVAELTATDEGDRLIVDPAVSRHGDTRMLGAALGRAIQMVVAADEHRSVVQRVARTARWERASRVRGRLLRRVTDPRHRRGDPKTVIREVRP